MPTSRRRRPTPAASGVVDARPRLPPVDYADEQFERFKATALKLRLALREQPDVPAVVIVEAFRACDIAEFKKQQVIYGAEVLLEALPVATGDVLAGELADLVQTPHRLHELGPVILTRVVDAP